MADYRLNFLFIGAGPTVEQQAYATPLSTLTGPLYVFTTFIIMYEHRRPCGFVGLQRIFTTHRSLARCDVSQCYD